MITADIIMAGLAASSKKQAFRLMSEAAAGLYAGDAKEVLDALLDRERIGSTGIGHGVAIPHIKIRNIERMYGVLACLEKPVDYDALDGHPVDIIFLLMAPAEAKTTQHLKVLAHISRFLKGMETCSAIRNTKERDHIAKLLVDWVNAQAA